MPKVKNKKVWKTKTVEGKTMMLCQNSDLIFSKYPDWAPSNGEKECKNWSEVGSTTTASLCWECTARSLKF